MEATLSAVCPVAMAAIKIKAGKNTGVLFFFKRQFLKGLKEWHFTTKLIR
jgi:hypothetical protein